MRASTVTTAILVASALVATAARATAPGAENWNAPAIAWHSLKTGIPEATRTGKTVVMVFSRAMVHRVCEVSLGV